MPLPAKPRFAEPCNHCGLCCKGQLCDLAQHAFPGASAPCPGLDIREDIALCSLLVTEAAAGMEPMLANALGVGCGCSMPDPDTTGDQVEEFDRVSFIRIHGRPRRAA